jgi:hypothetical protein
VSRDVTFADKAKATAQNIVSITTGLVSTTTPEEVANARADRAQDALDAYKDGDTTFGGYFSDDTESPMGEGPDDILLEEDKVTTEAADDTGYTTDESGNIICNNPDYIYDPVSQQCGPIGDSIKLNMPSRPIDMADVLQGITTNQVNIAPISGMQAGGMAGLNSAADKFIRSLAG